MYGFSAYGELPYGGLQVDYVIVGEAGAFELTGIEVNLVKFVGVRAETGAFTLTGQDALLGRYLYANTGAFTITGQAAGLDVSIKANVGEFTLTGQAAGLDTSIKAGTGVFTISAPTTTTARQLRLIASRLPADTDDDAHLFGGAPYGGTGYGGTLGTTSAETTFVLTGQVAELQRRVTLVAERATYTVTFVDARLEFAGRPAQIRAFPRVSRPMRGFNRGGGSITAKAGGGGFRARAFGG